MRTLRKNRRGARFPSRTQTARSAMSMSFQRFHDDTVKLNRLERLLRRTRDLMGHLGTATLEEQLQRIAEVARDVLDSETCSILLVKDKDNDNERGKELSLEATAGT